MRLVLYRPEIPQNVGALLRLSACWGIPIDCIGPFSFVWSDRKLQRAGMDYISKASYVVHSSWISYQSSPQATGRCVLLTTSASAVFWDIPFFRGDRFMVGSESSGVPPEIQKTADIEVRIPMCSGQRSLNLSMSAAIVLSEALRQQREEHF